MRVHTYNHTYTVTITYTPIHACTIMFAWRCKHVHNHTHVFVDSSAYAHIGTCDPCPRDQTLSDHNWQARDGELVLAGKGRPRDLRTLLAQGRRLESLLSRSFQKSLVLEVFVARILSNLSLEPSICILGCGSLTSESSMHLSSFCPSTCLSLFLYLSSPLFSPLSFSSSQESLPLCPTKPAQLIVSAFLRWRVSWTREDSLKDWRICSLRFHLCHIIVSSP